MVMTPPLALMPWPRRVTHLAEPLRLSALPSAVNWNAVRTLRLERAVAEFMRCLFDVTGGGLPLTVECGAAAAPFPDLGDDESYGLEVTAAGVSLQANTEWGVLRGLATLAQLTAARDHVPGVVITDSPRFAWRGLMIDVARHYIGTATLHRTLDAMALYKLNVLHLHLTDDQAFRFDSRAYPELATLGSVGGYYAEEELTDLVTHAAGLGIRVVPELDVPGHTTSWLNAHPEWGAVRQRRAPSNHFGVHAACLDPTRDDVYVALGRLFDDVARIFPDRFVHIGGDEVNPQWWRASAAAQAFMAEHQLADVAALQNLFNERLADLLTDRGRTLIGWDEIAHGELPRTSVVQSWRGGPSRDRAVAQGFDCVFSAGYYLDFFYPADLHYRYDPAASAADLAALDAAVRADPRLAHVRDGLGWAMDFAAHAAVDAPASSATPGRILGAEACSWSELVTDELLDVRIWGRLPALAERFWSPGAVADPADMYGRLAHQPLLLAGFAGVDIAERQAALFASLGIGADDLAQLRDLLDAVEPVKWYARLLGAAALRARVAGSTERVERPYLVDTPLDKIVDYIEPASLWVARFERLVTRLIADPTDREARDGMLEGTARWRRQRDVVRTLGLRVPAVAELDGLSQQLLLLADVVDARLDDTVGDRERAVVARAAEPVGELLIAVAPVLARWLDAR
jgi:hexosaminidase